MIPQHSPPPGDAPDASDPLRPRTPSLKPDPMADALGPGGPKVPTDVHIDAATGEISVSKGPVTIKVAGPQEGEERESGENGRICPGCSGNGTDQIGESCSDCGGSGSIKYAKETEQGRETSPLGRTIIDPAQVGHNDLQTKNYDDGGDVENEVVCPSCTGSGYTSSGQCSTCDGRGAVNGKDRDGSEKESSLKLSDSHTYYDTPWEYFLETEKAERDETRDPIFYATHDDPFAANANRYKKPKTVTVVADPPPGVKPEAFAYGLQLYNAIDVEVDGEKVRMKNIEDPIGLLNELKANQVDARVDGVDLPGYFKGMEVALTGDFPKLSYHPTPGFPLRRATLLDRKSNGTYVLRNDQWGVFEAEEYEFTRIPEDMPRGI